MTCKLTLWQTEEPDTGLRHIALECNQHGRIYHRAYQSERLDLGVEVFNEVQAVRRRHMTTQEANWELPVHLL